MAIDLEYIRASDGTGEAVRATVQAARSIGATTLQLDSNTNYPDKLIATTGDYNAETDQLEPGTISVMLCHRDGANIVIDEFAPGYSDAGNTVGQVVVIKPATAWADMIADFLGVSHNPDGTLNADVADELLGTGKTASNLRIKPRLSTAASGDIAPNINNFNYYRRTAATAAVNVANPTGTPNDGDGLLIEITGTAARGITWGTDYQANSQYGLSLPTTTVTTKTTFVTFVYNATTSKWVAVL